VRVCAALSMFQPRMVFCVCSPVSIALEEFFDRGGLLAGGVPSAEGAGEESVEFFAPVRGEGEGVCNTVDVPAQDGFFV